MRAFLITEVKGNSPTQIVIVTDDILIRKEVGRFNTYDDANVVFATFANLFRAIGFDTAIVPVQVLNPKDDPKHS